MTCWIDKSCRGLVFQCQLKREERQRKGTEAKYKLNFRAQLMAMKCLSSKGQKYFFKITWFEIRHLQFISKTSDFTFLQIGLKLSILINEEKKHIYEVITKSLKKFLLLMIPGAHNHSKPTRWQAFPIVVERESSGSVAGKSVRVWYRFGDNSHK